MLSKFSALDLLNRLVVREKKIRTAGWLVFTSGIYLDQKAHMHPLGIEMSKASLNGKEEPGIITPCRVG